MTQLRKKPGRALQKASITLRLPKPLVEQFRALARRNLRTLSGEFQIAIQCHLEHQGMCLPDPPALADSEKKTSW
jgi:hypothetical protein